jgi:(hydroxyamino)benzene mutase
VEKMPPAGVTPPATDVAGSGRHPLDPQPVPSTKARAVVVLGTVAVLTGPVVAGVVPATVGLLLAREARREAYAAGGFLTGGASIRRGEQLAWVALALAVTAVVVAVIIGLLDWAGTPAGQDYNSNVN